MDLPSGVRAWSWLFLVLYTGGMLGLGALGMRRIKGGDDFATARGAYGPLFLAFALTATTASAATFLGLPALAYRVGLPALWYAFTYPIGVYLGILLCLRVVSRAGHGFGSRSIPEYLGDRYRSDALRVLVAVFSLMLLFYLAGQMVAGIVMFHRMLGLSAPWALAITTVVLLAYVVLGGAHADILTDGIQGALMLLLAGIIVGLFATGFGGEGGFAGMLQRLGALDPDTLGVLYPGDPIVGSWWDVFAIVVAHLPLGLLPHIGNKLWALKGTSSRQLFIALSFTFGMLLPAIALGGLLARSVLGDALLAGGNPNEAIPALFIEILPGWMAALLGVGILAAVMSTADGLVVSSSQIFANDIYRRTLAPRWHAGRSREAIDRTALVISRWSTVGVLLVSLLLAWALQDVNIALLVWIGIGGMMAAFAGPLVLGVVWRGVTREGALSGFVSGAAAFIVLKAALVPASWFGGTFAYEWAAWLEAQAPNSFACATLGQGVSLAVTTIVSLRSEGLPAEHLDRVFGRPDER